jgi:hypothetical protein
VPTYVPHWRLTLSGTIGDVAPAPEIFSLGLSIGASAGPLGGMPNDIVWHKMLTASVAWFADAGNMISSNAHLTQIQLAAIGANGRFATDASGAYVRLLETQSGMPQPGGGVYNGTAPQVAVAVTLDTKRPGKVGRGRFFVPVPNTKPLSGNLLIPPGDAAGIAAGARDWINLINTALANGTPPQGPRVCVASGGSAKLGIAPANYPVTSVRVGRVLDTIRTRRNAVDEAYSPGQAVA